MGIVLIKLPVDITDLENMPEYGLVRIRSDTGTYYICHDFESHYWDITNDDAPTNLPQSVSDPDAHFDIINLVSIASQQLYALIKRPTFEQIKSSAQYGTNMIKYLLLSELLCSDVTNIIFTESFWLEMDYIYMCPTHIILAPTLRNESSAMRTFRNIVRGYPRDWMLRY